MILRHRVAGALVVALATVGLTTVAPPTVAGAGGVPVVAATSVDGAVTHEDDPTFHASGDGPGFYADPAPRADAAGDVRERRADAPRQAAVAAFPLDQTFRLASLPGAQRTIYLDFDGHRVSGTRWNTEKGVPTTTHAGLHGKTDAASFTDAELILVQQVWQRVADDYAPFAVNVTTADPGEAALVRTSAADEAFGMRVLFTTSAAARAAVCTDCAGAAYIQVFDVPGSGVHAPAWVFLDAFGDRADQPDHLAETASHEVGHTLGLAHDGHGTSDYHVGHGYWSPVMGLSAGRPLSQWSRGDYPGATNREDDLAVIAASGLPLRVDDHGDTPASATAAAAGRRATGVIGSATDRDVLAVTTPCAGTLEAVAAPVVGGNLDLRLRLLDRAGGVRTSGAQSTTGTSTAISGLDARLTAAGLPAGTWYVEVDGDAVVVGPTTAGVVPRSDYGSLGAWALTPTVTCEDGTVPPGRPVDVRLAPAAVGVLAGSWSAPTDGPTPDGYRVELFDAGGTVAGPFDVAVGTSTATTSASATGGRYQFGGLTASTVHALRVQTLVAGRPGVTTAATARTLPAAVARLGATRVTPTSFTVYWSPPPGAGAEVTGYVVTVGGRHRLHPASTRSIPLTGLTPGRSYDVAVRASTAQGNGAPADFTLRTPPASAPGPLSGLRAAVGPAGAPLTVTVHWGAADDRGAALQGYRLVAHRISGGARRVVVLAGPAARSQTLRLDPGTWVVDVQAYNRLGFGPASRTGRFAPR